MDAKTDIKPEKTANIWLILGWINHAVLIAIYSLGCMAQVFECTGDIVGGVMMAYGFTLFIPQAVFEFIVFVLLLVSMSNGSFQRSNIKHMQLYFGTMLIVAFILSS